MQCVGISSQNLSRAHLPLLDIREQLMLLPSGALASRMAAQITAASNAASHALLRLAITFDDAQRTWSYVPPLEEVTKLTRQLKAAVIRRRWRWHLQRALKNLQGFSDEPTPSHTSWRMLRIFNNKEMSLSEDAFLTKRVCRHPSSSSVTHQPPRSPHLHD
jgi:hypothetical protein